MMTLMTLIKLFVVDCVMYCICNYLVALSNFMAGQATAFFKDALVEYKTEERSEFFTVAKCEGGDK